ncbi:hypothetical protein SAMN05444003_3315 [Cognatiyoonia sediminum]|uniref:Uncharacterized protein n=1 Tax=Cognatiyoonia sediminum TaxID=1508389 RepID=A0A1M5TBP8_9RHOB|nr:hypothetical protein [Cognatiyoonia sediminum]SHH48139.1 hypothetical protein SAMN05444003_3315 [Cognatiyoonia sediminum]
MIRQIGLSAILIVSAEAAVGEIVAGGEFYEDRSGYPCFATLNTDAGKSVTLQLSDYKDVWSLTFIISDRASVYRRFFDSRGLRDEGAFEDAFEGVRIGECSFDFNDTSLFEVRRQDVDEKTAGIFSVDEQHNVARVLEAMADDGIEIEGLVSLDGTATVLSEFRSCSYAAMRLQEGERVETDFRAEYRMIFEGVFENWVTSMAQAEHCLATRFDDDAVSEVIDAAADAFYPGILNVRKRSEYRENLDGLLPMAKLSGMVDAETEGCLMAGRLADVSRMPVDRAIEEAAKLD